MCDTEGNKRICIQHIHLKERKKYNGIQIQKLFSGEKLTLIEHVRVLHNLRKRVQHSIAQPQKRSRLGPDK